MDLKSLYMNGRLRFGRTEILAGSATDTALLVDRRYVAGMHIFWVQRNHLDGPGRTLAGAIATTDIVGEHHTAPGVNHGTTDLNGGFLLLFYLEYGIVGANLGALGALRTAIAPFVGHLRLHETLQRGGRTKHIVRTHAHAELTGGAMPGEMLQRHGTRRLQRGPALNL